MNSLEQLKVAGGETLKRRLGTEEYEFYPLEVTELATLQDVIKRLGGDVEKATKQDLISLTELIIKMVKKSFPNKASENELTLSNDIYENKINQLVIKHFYQLQEILIELHTPNVDELSDTQRSKIEQLKAKALQKNADSGTAQATG